MIERVPVPIDVGPSGRELLADIGAYLARERLVPDEHEVIILHAAARQADRLATIRTALDGADVTLGWAVRLMAEERQGSANLAGLLVTKLGLPTALAGPGSTGSSPLSRRSRAGNAARWGGSA